MTTDTHPKEYAVSYEATGALAGHTVTVGGMCKGSGMIMPNMATMIAIITTDAPVAPEALHEVLIDVVKATFNKVTVDSDTSTNDTCIALATGEAAKDAAPIEPGTPEAAEARGCRECRLPASCARDRRRWRGCFEARDRYGRRGRYRRGRGHLRSRHRQLAAREDRHLWSRLQLGPHRDGSWQVRRRV